MAAEATMPSSLQLLWRLLFILNGTVGFVSRQINRKQRFPRQQIPVLALFGDTAPTIVHKNDNYENAVDDAIAAKNEKDNNVLLRQPTVILLSLQHPESTGRFSKTVADVWKWKDAVLGDGRDFFIPRPKTLAKLQRYLILQVEMINTIVVLSNCARLELLVIISPSQPRDCASNQQLDRKNNALLLEAISRALLLQAQDFQSKRYLVPPPIDWPSAIALNPIPTSGNLDNLDEMVPELARHWETYDTVQSVLTHWCQVAAGLSGRPNRPDRSAAFRPFSSRDAHIMLQLKRLVFMSDDATTSKMMLPKWIVDTALSAGKAARSNAIVQAHRPLLLDSTQAMPMLIAQRVEDEILEPLVQRALSQWNAKAASAVIQILRRQALELAGTDEERQWIQRTQLHNVTMLLRQEYETFDTESFLAGLEQRLEAQRRVG